MHTPQPMFDIMIVYDAHLAHSAAEVTYHESAPFAKNGKYSSCNAAYQYFIQYCKEQNLLVAFTTTADINALGQFKSAWTYATQWDRHQGVMRAKVVFDKFSNLLHRNHKVYQRLTTTLNPLPLFHNQDMRIMFDNKLETYRHFPDYAIPTVPVESLTKAGFQKANQALQSLCSQHPYPDDFTATVVLKDQFGLGGNNIYKIATEDDFLALTLNPAMHFVLQPFIQASGFALAEATDSTDLRVILCNNKIIQSYLRIAKTGEFRANAQQGGQVVYLTLDKIPPDVLKMVEGITQRLPIATAVCALDFIKSNHGHLYFIEGNNSPGLIWFDKEDETRAKELIHFIVKNLDQLILADEYKNLI